MSKYFWVFIFLWISAGADLHSQTSWWERFTEPLQIMEVLEGNEFDLISAPSQKDFFTDFTTDTYGVNGDYLGPVLILNRNDSVTIHVTSELETETTMHWHGMHVPPRVDGGPHSIIAPGETWTARFKVLDHAATYWYHPHPHRMTDEQVTRGLAGMIIVRDEEEAALDLPRSYGMDDLPLIIQSKAFNLSTGDIEPVGPETHFLVNGTVFPYVELPRQVVRLRLLNGSNLRVLNVGFSDDREFYMVGSDGGLLPVPVPLTRISLATGERAEILVDLSDLDGIPGDKIHLVNYSAEQPPGTPGTLFTASPSFLDSRNVFFLEIRGREPSKYPISEIPAYLSEPFDVWNEEEAAVTRHFNFEIDWIEFITSGFLNGFSIDNIPFDHHVINQVIRLNDIEIWDIYNNTPFGHPFHIHDVPFYILDRDGVPPPPHEQGRKDVVLVNGNERVRFITQFIDFADEEAPYMYHCHILSHEDAGMMGQFIVVDPVTAMNESLVHQDHLTLYPNPAVDMVRLQLDVHQLPLTDLKIRVFSVSGDALYLNAPVTSVSSQLNVSELPAGSYMVCLYQGSGLVAVKQLQKL